MAEEESYVKRYFEREGTVAKWWYPEKHPSLFRSLYIEQIDIIRGLFDPKNKVILDAGTGRGRLAIDFAKRGADHVAAVDLSDEMLKIAKQNAQDNGVQDKITFMKMDIDNLGFRDDVFDTVCCMETFVHLPVPERSMNELKRMLRKGGLLLANVTLPINWFLYIRNITSFPQLYEWAFTPIYSSRVYSRIAVPLLRRPRPVAKTMKPEDFLYLFQKANLEVLAKVPQGDKRSPRFLLVMAKKT